MNFLIIIAKHMKLHFWFFAISLLGMVQPAPALIIYSGRSEQLVGPLIKDFEKAAGYKVSIRYGKTVELAATLMEEGKRSPADVFFAQDVASLSVLAKAQRFIQLPVSTLERAFPWAYSPSRHWVGISARLYVVVYNNTLTEADFSDDLFGFCDIKWMNRIGWAPANSSFQSFITALRFLKGETYTKEWLFCMEKNHPRIYSKNSPIVAAVGSKEIDVGFVNHYYLYRFKQEHQEAFTATNRNIKISENGALLNAAGVGILKSSRNLEQANQFVSFLLTRKAQEYFAQRVFEYPLIRGVSQDPRLDPLSELINPNFQLDFLSDMDGTFSLLKELGIL